MLQRILGYFRSHPSKQRRVVPSSSDLPELWPGDRTNPRLEVLDQASTPILTALCDDYWNSFFIPDDDQPLIRDARVTQRALEVIATRGIETLQWARQRLSHPGYDAREDSASLIAQWAKKGILGKDKETVARELVILAVKPPKDDTKEAQAACVALQALSIIGGPACMDAIRQVLSSSDWDGDDNQWDCAQILTKLTNESFMEAEDPVAAAKAWLATNPTNKA